MALLTRRNTVMMVVGSLGLIVEEYVSLHRKMLLRCTPLDVSYRGPAPRDHVHCELVLRPRTYCKLYLIINNVSQYGWASANLRRTIQSATQKISRIVDAAQQRKIDGVLKNDDALRGELCDFSIYNLILKKSSTHRCGTSRCSSALLDGTSQTDTRSSQGLIDGVGSGMVTGHISIVQVHVQYVRYNCTRVKEWRTPTSTTKVRQRQAINLQLLDLDCQNNSKGPPERQLPVFRNGELLRNDSEEDGVLSLHRRKGLAGDKYLCSQSRLEDTRACLAVSL